MIFPGFVAKKVQRLAVLGGEVVAANSNTPEVKAKATEFEPFELLQKSIIEWILIFHLNEGGEDN